MAPMRKMGEAEAAAGGGGGFTRLSALGRVQVEVIRETGSRAAQWHVRQNVRLIFFSKSAHLELARVLPQECCSRVR